MPLPVALLLVTALAGGDRAGVALTCNHATLAKRYPCKSGAAPGREGETRFCLGAVETRLVFSGMSTGIFVLDPKTGTELSRFGADGCGVGADTERLLYVSEGKMWSVRFSNPRASPVALTRVDCGTEGSQHVWALSPGNRGLCLFAPRSLTGIDAVAEPTDETGPIEFVDGTGKDFSVTLERHKACVVPSGAWKRAGSGVSIDTTGLSAYCKGLLSTKTGGK